MPVFGTSASGDSPDQGPERIVRWTGTGDLSTLLSASSLDYGRGGSVNIVRDKKLTVIAEFSRLGPDCWCPSG